MRVGSISSIPRAAPRCAELPRKLVHEALTSRVTERDHTGKPFVIALIASNWAERRSAHFFISASRCLNSATLALLITSTPVSMTLSAGIFAVA